MYGLYLHCSCRQWELWHLPKHSLVKWHEVAMVDYEERWLPGNPLSMVNMDWICKCSCFIVCSNSSYRSYVLMISLLPHREWPAWTLLLCWRRRWTAERWADRRCTSSWPCACCSPPSLSTALPTWPPALCCWPAPWPTVVSLFCLLLGCFNVLATCKWCKR